MRELLALAAVACLDFWPGEVVERRIYLTWLASRDPWFMLRTIPGTVRGVSGSVVPSSLPANPVDQVIAPRRQFESLFATLLPKDAQVHGASFELDPCIPAEAELDGHPVDPAAIPLVDDGATHRVRVVVGEQAPSTPTTARRGTAARA